MFNPKVPVIKILIIAIQRSVIVGNVHEKDDKVILIFLWKERRLKQ